MPAAWETGAAKGQAVRHGPKQTGFTSLWAAGIAVSKGNRRRQTPAARTKVGEMFTPNTHGILGEGWKDGKSWIRFSTGRRALTRRVFFNQTPNPTLTLHSHTQEGSRHMGIWTALETLSQSGYCLKLKRCKPGFDLSSRFLPCGLRSRKSQRSQKEAPVGEEGFRKLPGPLRSCSNPSKGEATAV